MTKLECKKCGKCCSNYLPLTIKEKYKLKEMVKKNNLKPTEYILEEFNQFICPFLDSNCSCLIYNDRPSICKVYTCEKYYKKDFKGEWERDKYILTNIRKEVFK